MDLDLSGKTALITGASQGIGKASARELVLLGCRVVILARTESKLIRAIEEFERLSPIGHSYIVADLSDFARLKEQIPSAGSFDILVNNSGGPSAGLLETTDEEELQDAFRGHLQASALLTRLCLPGMKEGGYGRIINVLSASVKAIAPMLGVSNTVRWAVAGWAKTLSMEVGSFGITVNSVLPGATATERLKETTATKARLKNRDPEELLAERIEAIPVKRVATPEEIASVVAFLATPAAAFVNGAAIAVDGGQMPCI
jgi:3-oxoacyl-[acyl-carrier protein] reductase